MTNMGSGTTTVGGAPEPRFRGERMIEEARNRRGGWRGQKAIDGARYCRDEKCQRIEPERERDQAPQEEPRAQNPVGEEGKAGSASPVSTISESSCLAGRARPSSLNARPYRATVAPPTSRSGSDAS